MKYLSPRKIVYVPITKAASTRLVAAYEVAPWLPATPLKKVIDWCEARDLRLYWDPRRCSLVIDTAK